MANISDSFIVIEDDLSVKAKDITALSNQIKENINSEVFEVSGFPISGKTKLVILWKFHWVLVGFGGHLQINGMLFIMIS